MSLSQLDKNNNAPPLSPAVTGLDIPDIEKPALIMPHEDLNRPKSRIALRDWINYYRKLISGLIRVQFVPYEQRIDFCQNFFNGENVGLIHKKFEFIEVVRKLGFRGPEQVAFEPGHPEQLESALNLLRKYGAVLCKPKDGQQGKGIFSCEREEELSERLAQVDQGYIVQERVPPLKDYRYVYHEDPDVTYRVCYAKIRPVVVGDGRSSLSNLIAQSSDIPAVSKEKLGKFLLDSQLESIPESGEKVDLIDTGNISKGAYSEVVTGDELAALDKLMLALIKDIRDQYGLDITTYCFDIGALTDQLKPDTISKQDIVFYEYQVPFGLEGYLSSELVKENKNRVARMFAASLVRAWAFRKKAS
ncbi:MAG: hypothetical protein CMK89_06505 [Pseudomonadales bacterium]|nr:hypothetical protein [Pseudomonadales bacterium]